MGVGHGHAHGHSHGADPHGRGDERRLFWAMLLTAGFMGVELVGGIVANSLALLADAGHMVTDAASLALAWVAIRIARRPADPRRSYGYARFQVIAALLNGAALFAIVGWIAVEAVARIGSPAPVGGAVVTAVALAGLAVNLAAFRILHGGNRENLNLSGAALHVLSDLLGSAAALVAGIVIVTTGWTPIDPLLSLLVAALVLRSAWEIVRRSTHILMEGAPEETAPATLREELESAVPGVADIHHVHLWSLTPERPLLTLHARIAAGANPDRVLRDIKTVLQARFRIDHSTVQIEFGPCADDTPAAPPAAACRPS